MNDPRIPALLADLQSEEAATRQRATVHLWQIWFSQKGELGLELLRRAQSLLELGDAVQAERLLSNAIADYPDFAEAWNQRAILYFTLEEYDRSLADCKQVVQLNPMHFGAWHGLGLCQAALGEYRQAIAAFQQALQIQPHATFNQQLILECMLHLN